VRHPGRIEEFSQLIGSRSSGRATALDCGPANRHEISDRFPDIVIAATRQLPDGVVLDGELVILGADGRLSFDALQQRVVTSPARARAKAAELPASFAAFDLLAAGGIDLRTQRWTVRWQWLEQLARDCAAAAADPRSPPTLTRPPSGSRCFPPRWASRD